MTYKSGRLTDTANHDERQPLPSDSKLRAEILAGIERGYAQAQAGIGDDAEVVHVRLRARLTLPPV